MPAKSPEALERKRYVANARKKRRRAELRRLQEAKKPFLVLPPSHYRKWFIGPAAPKMSKSELRAMLTRIVQNTAAL